MPFDNRGKLGVGWGLLLTAAVASPPRVARLSRNKTADAFPAAKKSKKSRT
jgi:hypothetical protein